MKPRVSTLAALLLTALTLAGCATTQTKSLGAGVAARVGTTNISAADVQHWMQVNARQQQGTGAVLPDSPKFTACIADGQRQAALQKKTISAANLKVQCQQAYASIRDAAVGFLVQGQWVAQEDASRGITATSKEVSAALDAQRKKSFPTQAKFDAYLRQFGYTEADVLLRVRGGLLTDRLRANLLTPVRPATVADARSYYEANLSSYGRPETRDILLILSPTLAGAHAARAALSLGQSWARVAARYSSDPTAKTGGKLTAATAASLDSGLSQSAFAAHAGRLTGPVKSAYGYYLFKVLTVKPGAQDSFAKVQQNVVAKLNGQRQETFLRLFTTAWTKSSKARTVCAHAYMLAAVCGNATKAKQ